MPWPDKPFSDWDDRDLNKLLADPSAVEDSGRDFKAECKLLSEYKDAKEKARIDILKDISALANAKGGALLIGVRQSGKKGQAPTAAKIEGIGENPEQLKQTINSLVSKHLDVRPAPLRYHTIERSSGNPVLIVEVAANTYSLSMVTYPGTNQFWVRRGWDNHLMTTSEIQYEFSQFSKVQHILFLIESQKPLHEMKLIVTLKRTLVANEFHLIKAHLELHRFGGPTTASLYLAVEGKSRAVQVRSEALGAVISKAWSDLSEKKPILETIRGAYHSVDHMEGLFKLDASGPFRSIADMDQCHVFLYMAEQSIDYVRNITLFADDYQLFAVKISDLVIRRGSAPTTLAEGEETTQWVSLSLKGDSPEEWPTKAWQLYFADCVPKRVPQSRHWEPDDVVLSIGFPRNGPIHSV